MTYISNKTILHETDEVSCPYITFEPFDKLNYVMHGFSTRLGGVSEGKYSTMNLSFGNGDDEEKVLENHRRLAKSIGMDYKRIVSTHQVHTANVRVVTEQDCGKGIIVPRDWSENDAHITDCKNVFLKVSVADCVPVFLVDTEKKAVAAIHSGWRGTELKISKQTILKMQETFGTNPKDITAVIGPSICQDCYEVSYDVCEKFIKAFDGRYTDAYIKEIDGRYYLNLWEANRLILLEAGVKEENITVSGLCTCCNHELLFSHRATKGERGGMAGFIGITA